VKWHKHLQYDAVDALLQSGNPFIATAAKHDLLDQVVHTKDLWTLPAPQRILNKQQPDGSWQYPGAAVRTHIRSQENYDQIETYRNLGQLIELYGFTREHPAIEKAAGWLWSFQSAEGDIRGIYGDQYTPNYSAGITELLIKAGYKNDAHVRRVLDWLLSVMQNGGGWAIPIRTHGYKLDAIAMHNKVVKPDLSRPASWMVTGVVLRAFAVCPAYHNHPDVLRSRDLLLNSLFKKDRYPDRGSAEYWLRFTFPFWFTDLVSALDSLSLLGCTENDEQLLLGLDWLEQAQRPNGLWQLKILKGKSTDQLDVWLSLAICRIFKRIYGS